MIYSQDEYQMFRYSSWKYHHISSDGQPGDTLKRHLLETKNCPQKAKKNFCLQFQWKFFVRLFVARALGIRAPLQNLCILWIESGKLTQIDLVVAICPFSLWDSSDVLPDINKSILETLCFYSCMKKTDHAHCAVFFPQYLDKPKAPEKLTLRPLQSTL